MSSFISLQSAVALTSNFRSNKETVLDTPYRNQGTLPVCETFDKSDVDTLLAQSGCTQLRIYLAMDGEARVKMILVAVNSSDEDILPTGFTPPLILEEGSRCPDDCPPSSDMNS